MLFNLSPFFPSHFSGLKGQLVPFCETRLGHSFILKIKNQVFTICLLSYQIIPLKYLSIHVILNFLIISSLTS